MADTPLSLRWIVVSAATVALAGSLSAAVTHARAEATEPARARILPITGAAALPPSLPRVMPSFGDSLLGASGALRIHLVPSRDLPMIVAGESAAAPGIYPVSDGIDGRPFALVALRRFSLKVGSWVNGYLVGYWPAERHRIHSTAYANPAGFVEVTPANEDTYVSEHFRLRDFLTHDQAGIWPKYVVLREPLLDKLELVLQDLARHGINTSHVVVLSGFRTPAYNLALGDASGRARESRHQYGDAADIIIDGDHNGRMDDLNLDGRVDRGDVRVIERAVERVERAYPDLAGGLGLYDATGPHGPFAHIDAERAPPEVRRRRRGSHAGNTCFGVLCDGAIRGALRPDPPAASVRDSTSSRATNRPVLFPGVPNRVETSLDGRRGMLQCVPPCTPPRTNALGLQVARTLVSSSSQPKHLRDRAPRGERGAGDRHRGQAQHPLNRVAKRGSREAPPTLVSPHHPIGRAGRNRGAPLAY